VPTVDQLLERGRLLLHRPGIDLPRREAAHLLGHLLAMSEAALLAHGRDAVDPAVAHRFENLVARRADGEPAAYLTGRREFWGREFSVDDRVLVPRPETEHLVELALELPLPSQARVLDVGTGSGALAVTLAAERAGWQVWASDLSPAAIALARFNAHRHGVPRRVRFLVADLLAGLATDRFDLVVSNPPYVDRGIASSLAPEVAHFEPQLALFAGQAGLAVLAELLRQARALRPGAHLACEIGFDQLTPLRRHVAEMGGWEFVTVRRDWAGHDRVVLWQRSGAPA